jgi:hypothetical protein
MRARTWLFTSLALVAACAEDESRLEAEQQQLEQRAAELAERFAHRDTQVSEGLSVQLVFEGDADLDLYVTGPLLETVYFANRTSKSGGQIGEDIRCDSAGPRLEEVVFETPLPGKYRVGVDFPKRCKGENGVAPFAVSVLHSGGHQQVTGQVLLQQFEIVVLEVEL